jgi:hypothetical protein
MTEFKATLEQIRGGIPASMLKNAVRGMSNRMQLVVGLGGDNIGK